MAHPTTHAMNRRGFLRRSGWTGLGLLLCQARLLADEPHPSRSPLNRLSDEDEIALGDLFAKDLERELPIVSNTLQEEYLNGLVRKLAAVSQRPGLPYKCFLVNADVLNAFSIAGGRIYLYRGLVETIDKEDELVATLSHEIGHIVGRHSADNIMLTFRARQAYDLVKDRIPQHTELIQQVIAKLGGALATLAMLHFSREDEYEADQLGLYETVRAGWEPNGFLSLFETFAKLEKQSSSIPMPLLRDHPPAEDRAQAIQRELSHITVAPDATRDSLSFHAFQLSMKLLPEPPKPEAQPAPARQNQEGTPS